MNQLVRLASPAVRALVTAAGERASMRFLEPGAAHRLVVHYAARIEAGTRELAVSGAELEVRIHSAPAESPRTIGSCPTLQVRRRYPESFPLLHGHEFGHCAIEHGSIRKLGTSSKAMIRFWERPEVKFLPAQRRARPFSRGDQRFALAEVPVRMSALRLSAAIGPSMPVVP